LKKPAASPNSTQELSQKPFCGIATLSFSAARLALALAISAASAIKMVRRIVFSPTFAWSVACVGYCPPDRSETIGGAAICAVTPRPLH
jgi:hypothetical protein